MNICSKEVYKYNELEEEAKKRAYEGWLYNNPCEWLLNDLQDSLYILRTYGVDIDYWRLDRETYDVKVSRYSLLTGEIETSNIKGLSSLKKVMKLYSNLTIKPISYRIVSNHSGIVDEISKTSNLRFKYEIDEDHPISSFCKKLKALIDKKDLSLNLYDYLSISLNTMFKSVYKEYRYFTSRRAFEEEITYVKEVFLKNGEYYGVEDDFENQLKINN
jgi:hypothetical protein